MYEIILRLTVLFSGMQYYLRCNQLVVYATSHMQSTRFIHHQLTYLAIQLSCYIYLVIMRLYLAIQPHAYMTLIRQSESVNELLHELIT